MAAQPILVDVADGVVLDGDVELPPAASAAVVLTHPHPLYGGNRHSNVTDALFRALAPLGVAALRFDFRGVGRSTGQHDGGDGERLDTAAAIDLLSALVPEVPLVLAGYSFGSDVALNVTHPAVAAWFAVAPPLGGPRFLASSDHRPKLLAIPEHDQYDPPKRATELTRSWVNTEVTVVAQGDHFLAGRLLAITDLLVGFLRSTIGAPLR